MKTITINSLNPFFVRSQIQITQRSTDTQQVSLNPFFVRSQIQMDSASGDARSGLS